MYPNENGYRNTENGNPRTFIQYDKLNVPMDTCKFNLKIIRWL